MRKISLIICFICLNLVMAFAQVADTLIMKARSLVEQNRPADAAFLFEKIAENDVRNYESLAFLANYHFLLGQQLADRVESDFLKLSQPNRMQIAGYHEELKRIYYQCYEKAGQYLLKALDLQKNDHLNKLLLSIQAFKEKADLMPARTKKK